MVAIRNELDISWAEKVGGKARGRLPKEPGMGDVLVVLGLLMR